MLEFQILKTKRLPNSGLSFWVSVWLSGSIGKFPNYLLLPTFNFILSVDAQSIANILQQFSTRLPQPGQLLFPARLFIYFEKERYGGYNCASSQLLHWELKRAVSKPWMLLWKRQASGSWTTVHLSPWPQAGLLRNIIWARRRRLRSGFTLPGMFLFLFIAGWLHEKKSIWHFKIFFLGYIGLSSCC